MLIFDKGEKGRGAGAQRPSAINCEALADLPSAALRKTPPALPEVSELQVVRHYTRLSRKNFSIDTNFYPLGSCTMKYNPRGTHKAASQPGFVEQHPLAPASCSQGLLALLFDLQTILKEITGMDGVSLSPMAGAQGELAGIAMIRACHLARGDTARSEIIVPDAAHGTNPASAVMCGYRVREVPVAADGDVSIDQLKQALSEKTAGLMLTNPSTCGVFERQIKEITALVHEAGGFVYYDGANLNAILGKVRPGDMGFDVMHLNLHKTFATPHGGGGPGAGPVCATEKLAPYLPVPIAGQDDEGYRWLDQSDRPQSIGRLSAFQGNTKILLQALSYALMLGREGMTRVSEYATLNANYVARRLQAIGFDLAYPDRLPTHEFIVTCKDLQQFDVTVMDVAKRLLDFGIHAPTTYFPLLVPECLLIEPTETEDKAELDAFIEAMQSILQEAGETPEKLRTAPHSLPSKRLDEVVAAKNLDVRWLPQPA